MDSTNDRLVRIAWQYYVEDLTQKEIAERFNISRPKVARLLKEARERGIVEFHIRGVPYDNLHAEQQLRTQFDLNDAIVVPTHPEEELNRGELGRAAAQYLERVFKPDMIIGLGMGTTLAQIPGFISSCPDYGCTFAEMVGGSSRTDTGLDTYNISWQLAEQCNGVAVHVNSPVMVKNEEFRDMLLSDPQIISALETSEKSDLALVGIGPVSEDMTLARLGYCDEETFHELKDKGAVCDVIGHYFDLAGRLVHTRIEDRLIGLKAEQIMKIPQVIGVAGWSNKARAIVGALHSGLLNVLITDQKTAQRILAIARDGGN